jgi:4-diphosphocytidyl-2-C-methyl-D-erythritol kinase
MTAPAKLTLSLRITGRTPDGYHTIEAEMVTVDLCDELEIDPAGDGLEIVGALPGGSPLADLGRNEDNLVTRALRLAGRRAGVRLRKRIPPRAGLGGGSADAGAVLRWAGGVDPADSAVLGADVPFCLVGGRVRVGGIGERLEPLPHVDQDFVLLLPPLGVDTGACYRAWDALADEGPQPRRPEGSRNDLEAAALAVTPELARWRDALAERTGRRPQLAGSGATWFVEGSPSELDLDESDLVLRVGRSSAPLVPVTTVGPLSATDRVGTSASGVARSIET